MSKKIQKWQEEIITCQKNIKKQNERINELKNKIKEEQRREENANNKLIADVVRNVYGDVNEENVGQFMAMLQKNGHTLNGGTESV